MQITHGHQPGSASEQRSSTFSGAVWADSVLAGEGAPTVNTVVFQPGARTHWHSHELGQLLLVTAGSGVVQVRDGERARVQPGDVVWFPPGEVHWHGADLDTLMSHLAISLGTTNWGDPVADGDYEASCRALGG